CGSDGWGGSGGTEGSWGPEPGCHGGLVRPCTPRTGGRAARGTRAPFPVALAPGPKRWRSDPRGPGLGHDGGRGDRRRGRGGGLTLLEPHLLLAGLQNLDDRRRAGVAEPAVVLLDDPGVPARPVLEPRADVPEQLLEHRVPGDRV